jgi:hypothetical protein
MSLTTALLIAALPALGQQQATDRIALRFEVHDDVALKLSSPSLRLDLGTAELVPLLDDGSLPGDVAGDHVWVAETELRRVQRLSFTLLDTATGQAHGDAGLFLPAADEATIRMRTMDGDPPLVIEGEGGASSSGDGSASAATSTPGAVASEGSGDRFTYLLWVVLLLGLLGFGYMRVVVRRIYLQDFLPTWRKLDRWLDRELEGSD